MRRDEPMMISMITSFIHVQLFRGSWGVQVVPCYGSKGAGFEIFTFEAYRPVL
jgi:hypothetical protein